MGFGVSPARYVELARTLHLTDLLVGIVVASLHAAVAFAVLQMGGRAWASRAWPLVAKWIVGFIALWGTVGAATALVSCLFK